MADMTRIYVCIPQWKVCVGWGRGGGGGGEGCRRRYETQMHQPFSVLKTINIFMNIPFF